MKVYVVVGLYKGLPDRIGVFVDETVANACKQGMEKEGLEATVSGAEEVDTREEKGLAKPIIPYEDREKWAVNTLADLLGKVLIEFDESEQNKISLKLGNYMLGYLGLSFGLRGG